MEPLIRKHENVFGGGGDETVCVENDVGHDLGSDLSGEVVREAITGSERTT